METTESTVDHKDVAASASGAPAQNGVAVTATKIKTSLLDLTLQTRAATNPHTISEYAERMTEGDQFPPVVVFEDADHCYWLADGFHRVRAAQQCDFVDIECDVRKGSRSEALKHALKANAIHGLQRTNADKRRCVELALKEFGGMTDSAIGGLCGVSNHFAKSVRDQVGTVPTSKPDAGIVVPPPPVTDKRIGKDGKSYPVKGVAAPATAAKTDHAANLRDDHADAIEKVAKLMGIDPELVRQAMREIKAESAFPAGIETVKTLDEGEPRLSKLQRRMARPAACPQSSGVSYAAAAISQMERIHWQDRQRKEGFEMMDKWMADNR